MGGGVRRPDLLTTSGRGVRISHTENVSVAGVYVSPWSIRWLGRM